MGTASSSEIANPANWANHRAFTRRRFPHAAPSICRAILRTSRSRFGGTRNRLRTESTRSPKWSITWVGTRTPFTLHSFLCTKQCPLAPGNVPCGT